MTDTDEITTTAAVAETGGVPVPGWERPAWAEEFLIDGGNYVTFKRTARRMPLVYRAPTPASEDAELIPYSVSVSRSDELLSAATRRSVSRASQSSCSWTSRRCRSPRRGRSPRR